MAGIPTPTYYSRRRGRAGGRLAFWGLVALAGYAVAVTALGSGYGTADYAASRVQGVCVELTGTGWAAATCGHGGAVDASTLRTSAAGAVGTDSGALSPADVKALWVASGGDPDQAGTAAAVATAESGRRPNAVHQNSNGTTDRGIFQMNSVHGGCSTFDLNANVRCAADLQHRQGWTPWATYTSGAYLQFVGY